MTTYLTYLLNIIQSIFTSFTMRKDDDSGSTKEIQKHIPSIKKDEAKGNKSKVIIPELIIVKPKFYLGTTGRITSNFGWRRLPQLHGDNKVRFHGGIDFSANRTWGFPCKALESGIIIRNTKGRGRNGITTVAIKGDHSKCYIFLCHIGSKSGAISPLVHKGQHVKGGQVVGFCNKTGGVTGPHLHLTIFDPNWNRIDPMCYYDKYAPEISEMITYYKDRGHISKDNKTGKKCGVL